MHIANSLKAMRDTTLIYIERERRREWVLGRAERRIEKVRRENEKCQRDLDIKEWTRSSRLLLWLSFKGRNERESKVGG